MKKYIGLAEMSHVNCSTVLSVIRDCGEVSRKQISDITGLSWGGMTKIVNKLFEHEYIVEDKCENTTGIGRIPNMIRINKEKHLVIGLDINRVGFSARVVSLAGDLQKEYWQEVCYRNKKELLSAIMNFTGSIVDEFQDRDILSIGIAMQGLLDVEHGISVKFPHCPDWKEVPIKDILEQKFGFRVFVEHDPNCMLYSCMSEEIEENMLLLRLDSSVGMAVSIGGEILRGNRLLEVAHSIVVPHGKMCRCGKEGCLEAYVSPCIVEGQLQTEAVEEMLEPMTFFLHNMVHIFNSEKIILTGKLIKYHSEFEDMLRLRFYACCEKEDIDIQFAEEANLAVQGAVLIAVQGAIEQLRL